MMLSTVEIFAAGETGEEAFNLLIDGTVVETFEGVGGDFEAREFQQFVFESDTPITADQVSIEFINDNFDPDTGRDNNLFLDGIVIDGVGFETEAPTTFSTGIFADGGLTGPGFLETEVININGTVSFLSDGSGVAATPAAGTTPVIGVDLDGSRTFGTRIRVDALGETGEENVQIQIDGVPVADFVFTSANTQSVLLFETSEIVDISRVRVLFTNDAFDPATGADRNVIVSQFQTIDIESGSRQIFDTTDGQVFASASFTEADGVQAGFARGGILTDNAFLEVRDTSTRIRVDAQGAEGDEVLQVVLAGEVIGTFVVPTERSTFFLEVPYPVDIKDLEIQFVNDAFDAQTGFDRNLTVFNFQTIDLATGDRVIAGTRELNVFGSGVFSAREGIVDGFGRGDTLVTNGFFRFTSV